MGQGRGSNLPAAGSKSGQETFQRKASKR